MIVRITGKLIEVNEDSVVLDRDGLAYEVLIPSYAVVELAGFRGRQVTFFTREFFEGNQASGHLIPRLLGFVSEEDKLFFSRFVSVKGIGPRKALKALAEPVARIASWIETGDVKSLARLPGIGKRAAELIVASLKGKMSDLAVGGGLQAAEAVELTRAQMDAREVLVAWGDTRADVDRWLQKCAQTHPETGTADEWVRLAYRVKGGLEP